MLYFVRYATQQDRPKTVSDVIQDFDVLYGHNAFSVSPCQPFSINCCYVSLLEKIWHKVPWL